MKPAKKILESISLALFILLLVGCGGGSSGTGTFTSGLDNSRTLESLSTEEAEAICAQLKKYGNRVVSESGICTFFSLIFSFGDEQACIEQTEQCLLQPDEDESDGEYECILNLQSGFKSCELTVAELETCLRDALHNLEVAFDGISCSYATQPDKISEVANAFFGVSEAPSCVSAEAKCPLLFEMEEDE